jgi:hypothetical protein
MQFAIQKIKIKNMGASASKAYRYQSLELLGWIKVHPGF